MPVPKEFRRLLSAHVGMRDVALAAILVAGLADSASAGSPSFSCSPAPTDALDSLACKDDQLGSADARLIQTYYSLRYAVGKAGQDALKSSFLAFLVDTRQRCGMPPVQPKRDTSADPIPASAAACVADAYNRQRRDWITKLSGAAAEEASRDPEQNRTLQTKLRDAGYLPVDALIDGVFGTGTRQAITSWQAAEKRSASGLLGDADAALIANRGSESSPIPVKVAEVSPLAPKAELQRNLVESSYRTLRVSIVAEPPVSGRGCTASNVLLALPTDSAKLESCRIIRARVSDGGRENGSATLAVADSVSQIAEFHLSAEIVHLDASSSQPQVFFTGYTGGAHCCTSAALATYFEQSWHFLKIGESDDGQGGWSILDVLHDGSLVLARRASGFNYIFSSYAGSQPPLQLWSLSGLVLTDVTKAAPYHEVLVHDLAAMEESWAKSSHFEPNGYLAGWVAEKALLNDLQDGWSNMLRTYDRGADWSPVDHRDFPKALAAFLVEHGYATQEEVDSVTASSAEDLWFILTNDDRCIESSNSPADQVKSDRLNRLADDVGILDSDASGKALAVEVKVPEGNGLVLARTYYRGQARCQQARENRLHEIERLK